MFLKSFNKFSNLCVKNIQYFSASKYLEQITSKYQIPDLQQSLLQRLEVVNEQFQISNQILNSSSEQYSQQDKEQHRQIQNELQYSSDIYNRMSSYIQVQQALQQQAQENKDDQEVLEIILEELEQNKQLLAEIQEECINELIPKEKYDNSDEITIEVRPGVGGSESSLFSEDVFYMYQNYCSIQGWNSKVQTFQKDMAINKGVKVGVLKVMGEGAYKKLKAESGVHKVIRVPETEKAGRLHSSTISVVVLPVIPFDFQVDEKDLKFEYMRAQGAGGQHVNKVSSACRCTHVESGISVIIQESRQQHNNKAKAIEIIKEKLFQIEVTKYQDRISSERQQQMGSGDRSDKIRTYNFPQSRITDHRTNLTLYSIEKMLTGEYLDEFITAYNDQIQNEKIQIFLKSIEKEKKEKQKQQQKK